jgi:hypothetical protein
MVRKRTQERQTRNLRLSFFTSIGTPSSSNTKWVILPRTKIVLPVAQRDASFYLECDCACK